jgi:phosphatidylserine/phosphatidylglycerophosphate/cardiolipin synthase-like enzyme
VRIVAYDLNEPEVVTRLEQLGNRLKIIIDDSATHGESTSAETQAETRLIQSAGADHVKRQHMKGLQHNKTIVVNGLKTKKIVCGSTNFTWRGFFVQANNAIILQSASAVLLFENAFDHYFNSEKTFTRTPSAEWSDLGLPDIDAEVTFSPHQASNSALGNLAADIQTNTTSTLFYSLAFLYQTKGPVRDAIEALTQDPNIFVYGISDRKVGGLDIQIPDGNVAPVFPSALSKNVPEPFKSEPTGGGGIRMHHKFVVIDFDKPTARVYLGSYNFSSPADGSNGENLLLIRDKRVAVAYMIEAIRLFDHYHFRVAQADAKKARKSLNLAKPPRTIGEKAWWEKYYSDTQRIHDREVFS